MRKMDFSSSNFGILFQFSFQYIWADRNTFPSPVGLCGKVKIKIKLKLRQRTSDYLLSFIRIEKFGVGKWNFEMWIPFFLKWKMYCQCVKWKKGAKTEGLEVIYVKLDIRRCQLFRFIRAFQLKFTKNCYHHIHNTSPFLHTIYIDSSFKFLSSSQRFSTMFEMIKYRCTEH